MPLFGCANDEQFYDELYDELCERDYDLHYCESHDSYYCPDIEFCNPDEGCYPAMSECRAFRKKVLGK